MPTAARKPLTRDALQGIATHVANRAFPVTVAPHPSGHSIEVGGAYVDADASWLSKWLRKLHGLRAQKRGGYVIVTGWR